MTANDSVANDFVAQQIRRTNRNTLVVNGIFLAIFALIGWLSHRYFYFFFLGPVALTDAELLDLAKSPRTGSLLSYVELGRRPVIAMGWKEVTTQDDVPIYDSQYYLLQIEQSYLLILSESPEGAKHLLGPLSRLRDFDQRVIDKFVQQHPEYRDRILPMILNDAAAFNVIGYIGLVLLTPFVLLCLYNVARAVYSLASPLRHPLVRRLSRYGSPADIVNQIDADMRSDRVLKVGRAWLTERWLLRPTVYGMKAFPLSDLIWIYHAALKHESFAVLYFRDGRKNDISLKSADADQLIAEVTKRFPWVIGGYTKELGKSWKSNRASIIAEVDRKRRSATE